MNKQSAIHIVDLCRRISQLHETIENRFQEMTDTELAATLETEMNKPDFLLAVNAKLSELTGITREDVAEFMHRAANTGNWSVWNRADGTVWPDISNIAQNIILADSTHFLTDEIVRLMFTNFPVEAQAIGLNRNNNPVEPTTAIQAAESKTSEWPKRVDGESLALAVLVKNPGFTMTQIAELVGCDRRTLYKWHKFQQARDVLKAQKSQYPRGTKDGETGQVEAWEDTN